MLVRDRRWVLEEFVRQATPAEERRFRLRDLRRKWNQYGVGLTQMEFDEMCMLERS